MGFLSRLFGKKQESPKPAPARPAVRRGVHEDDTARRKWEESAGVPQELAAKEVLELLETPTPPLLLDVREDHERTADGWIPGSVHIPMGLVPTRLGELDPSRPVVVYCASGMRSMDAGALLLQRGFKDVSNLNGGIHGWTGPRERRPS